MEHRTHSRPRSKSGFSFKSEKSDKSDKLSRPKVTDLHETAAERQKQHFSNTSKANPLAAMSEAQPIAAALEKPTLGSLRAMQHKDANGQLITEPDLSNPTRPRWERPLDTIRSFEAAIDGQYKRRSSVRLNESTPQPSGYTSRRSSYYGGNEDTRSYYARGRDSYNDTYGAPPVAAPTRNRYGQRMQSDYTPRQAMQGQGPYPSQYYQHSRDTVITGMSNSSGEPWSGSTDPSSENSSIERSTPNPKPDLGEQYGFNGFGGNPIMEEYDYNSGYAPPVNGYVTAGYSPQQDYSGPPPPPPHSSKPNNNNNMVKLGDGPPSQPISSSTNGAGGPVRRPQLDSQDSDKRKSWFKRRFSKE